MSPQITLTQVGTTFLYTAGGTFAFLLWDNSQSVPSVPLADTWSTAGPPSAIGYYLFLATPSMLTDAAALEAALRAKLPAPTATGCVWVANGGAAPALVGVLPITAAPGQPPVVATSMAFALPPGVPSVGIAANSPITTIEDGFGQPVTLLVSPPPIPGAAAQPPLDGVQLALAAPATGCLRFHGLLGVQAPLSATSAVKQVVAMQIDPLDVFGANSGGEFAAWSIVLSQQAKGYRFTR